MAQCAIRASVVVVVDVNVDIDGNVVDPSSTRTVASRFTFTSMLTSTTTMTSTVDASPVCPCANGDADAQSRRVDRHRGGPRDQSTGAGPCHTTGHADLASGGLKRGTQSRSAGSPRLAKNEFGIARPSMPRDRRHQL